ncbi:MAG: hypothetical protein ABJZ55_20370 [Fuerstiella sp.]
MSAVHELKPVLFSTIDRELMLSPGTVAEWALRDGFPAAADGVAILPHVEEWAGKQRLIAVADTGDSADGDGPVIDPVEAASVGSDPVPVAPAEQSREPAENQEIEWIEIRIPVVRGTKTILAARSTQTFSCRPQDLAVRSGWGDFLAGCKAAGLQLRDGKQADDFSKVFRLIGEQLADKNTNATQ